MDKDTTEKKKTSITLSVQEDESSGIKFLVIGLLVLTFVLLILYFIYG